MNLYRVLTLIVLQLFLSKMAYAENSPQDPLQSHHSSSSCSKKPCTNGNLEIISDIKILGVTAGAGLLLENNVLYEPLSQTYKRIARRWQIGDTVRLYKIQSKEDRFFLLNFTTGETIKARLKCL